jgi:hypothetical protein
MSYAFYVLHWLLPIITKSRFTVANRVNGSCGTIRYAAHAVS